MQVNKKMLAEKFFRAVYGGNLSDIDDLIGDDVVSSYPIFKKLYNSFAIRGREAIKDFAKNFSNRWINSKITIHESVEENNKVVLIWSFHALLAENEENLSENSEHSWGGITLFKFDESNKIVSEVGEESEPGPIERLIN